MNNQNNLRNQAGQPPALPTPRGGSSQFKAFSLLRTGPSESAPRIPKTAHTKMNQHTAGAARVSRDRHTGAAEVSERTESQDDHLIQPFTF